MSFTSILKLMFALAVSTPLLHADTPEATQEKKQEQECDRIAKLSEAFGYLIAKNIETIGIPLDIAKVRLGLQHAAEGKDSPMTEAECIQAISLAQETQFKELSEKNLKKANEFLAKNVSAAGVINTENGKLQYKIEKEGTGQVVEEHSTPLIQYVGKYLDGTVFGSSKEAEAVSLDETIAGFSKGLLGMKEGEKRTIFIHPDLGYGANGYLPPNSLLTFEVELVTANAPQQQEETASIISEKNKPSAEISSPSQQIKEDVR